MWYSGEYKFETGSMVWIWENHFSLYGSAHAVPKSLRSRCARTRGAPAAGNLPQTGGVHQINRASVCPFSGEHNENGSENDLNVKNNGHIFEIIEIIKHLLLHVFY